MDGKQAFAALPQEKQDRILNAAMEVFAQNEYKRASTADIAAKAGVAKGLLFYYFKNKQELYLYCYDYAVSLLRGAMTSRRLRETDDFFELMNIGAQIKLDQMEKMPWLAGFSVRAFSSRGESISPSIQQRVQQDLEDAGSYFAHVDFSRFREGVDPGYLLRMLTWMTEGYLDEKLRAGEGIHAESMMEDYRRWEQMLRRIAYKEEYQ